jgi:hypothetical protein
VPHQYRTNGDAVFPFSPCRTNRPGQHLRPETRTHHPVGSGCDRLGGRWQLSGTSQRRHWSEAVVNGRHLPDPCPRLVRTPGRGSPCGNSVPASPLLASFRLKSATSAATAQRVSVQLTQVELARPARWLTSSLGHVGGCVARRMVPVQLAFSLVVTSRTNSASWYAGSRRWRRAAASIRTRRMVPAPQTCFALQWSDNQQDREVCFQFDLELQDSPAQAADLGQHASRPSSVPLAAG